MSRCSIFNIKVKLNYYECKCDEKKKFCSEHRYPFNHNCSIDYKKINESKKTQGGQVV